MAYPVYPSLIPRYVDESWFSSDQPIDEAAKLNELEANQVWIRNVDVHTPHIETIDDDGNDDEDEDEMNEDDEEDDEDMEDGDDIEEEYIANESPPTI